MEDQSLNNSLQIAVVPQSFLDGLMKEVKEVKSLLRQKVKRK